MKPRLHVLSLLLVAGLLSLSACKATEEAQGPPLTMEEQLIEQHIAARGGLDNLTAVQSVTWEGSVDMMGMSMPLTMTQKRPGRLRIDVAVPSMGMEVVQAYDGETAWTLNPMQSASPIKLPESMSRSMVDQADIDGLMVGYAEKGITVTYEGEEMVRDRNTHKLKLARADQPDVLIYLDAETMLEAKIEGEGLNPQTGAPAMTESYPSDYREMDGVLWAFKIEIHIDGMSFQEIQLKSVEVNPDIDDKLFAFPN